MLRWRNIVTCNADYNTKYNIRHANRHIRNGMCIYCMENGMSHISSLIQLALCTISF